MLILFFGECKIRAAGAFFLNVNKLYLINEIFPGIFFESIVQKYLETLNF